MKKIFLFAGILFSCFSNTMAQVNSNPSGPNDVIPNSHPTSLPLFELSLVGNAAIPMGTNIESSLKFNPAAKLGYRVSNNLMLEMEANILAADPSFNIDEYAANFADKSFATTTKTQSDFTKTNLSLGIGYSLASSGRKDRELAFSLHGGMSSNQYPNLLITQQVNGAVSTIASYSAPEGYPKSNFFVRPSLTYTYWLSPAIGIKFNAQFQKDLGTKEFTYTYKDLTDVDFNLEDEEVQFQVDRAPVIDEITKGVTGFGSFGVGVVFGFGKGGNKKVVSDVKADIGIVKPSRTPIESLLLPSQVPNGGGQTYCVHVAHKTLISNNPPQGAIYSTCAMYSGYLCFAYVYPCGDMMDYSYDRIKGSLFIPSIGNFSGNGYLPVVLKLDGKKDNKETGGELIIDQFLPVEGDLSASGISEAYYVPGNYQYNKNNEVTLQIYFVKSKKIGSHEPMDNLTNPSFGWCTVKKYRDNNCLNGGFKWCGEYTAVKCGGTPIEIANSLAYSPFRIVNPDKNKNDSISILHFGFKSMAQVDSLGQALAKAWGKDFEIEKHEGRSYMKFSPITSSDNEMLLFPIFTPTPSFHLINDGYSCTATNCNCVGDCYCVTSPSNPQYGTCVKGGKISIGHGDDWTYHYD